MSASPHNQLGLVRTHTARKATFMRLMRFGDRGSEIPAVQVAGTVLDATSVTDDFHPEFFAGGGLDRLRAVVEAGNLPELDTDDMRIGAPLARPQALICIGQNYAAHAAESGNEAPKQPIIFFKHPNTLVGPNDHVRIPRGAQKVDWEVELAVVIGTEARYLSSPDQAAGHIAGYAVSNDVSERDFQIAQSGGQWSKGKCAEDFQPLGPWLVVDEIDDPQQLNLQSSVNGQPRQNSSTADMVFTVAELIHHLSQYLVLSPGDVINTGTPQGVALSGRFPYLTAGDTMELTIDGLGRQRQKLIAFDA